MSQSFKQTILFFMLLMTANIIAGQLNVAFGFRGNIAYALESMLGLLWYSTIFWLGCQWKPHSNLRFYFLPIIHGVFWLSIVINGFICNNRMASEDLLYAFNEHFFWWNSVKILDRHFEFFNDLVELFIVDIFFVSFGQFMLILSAIQLEKFIFYARNQQK